MARARRTAAAGATAGLALLLVVDAGLVAMALHHKDPPASRTAAVSAPAGSPVAAGSNVPAAEPATDAVSTPTAGTTTPTPSRTSPSGAPVVAAAPLRVLLATTGADVAWVGSIGTCASGGATATLRRTTDAGKHWRRVEVPLAAVTRVKLNGATDGFAVGTGAACRAGFSRTRDGAGWSANPAQLHSTWWRDPADGRTLHTPGQRDAKPCGSARLVDAVVDSTTRASALCDDGRVVMSRDAGRTWQHLSTVPGALALSAGTDGSTAPADLLVAVSGAKDCEGLAVQPAHANADPLACVTLEAPASEGQVALAAAGGAAWLVAGDSTYRSTDAGRTWKVTG